MIYKRGDILIAKDTIYMEKRIDKFILCGKSYKIIYVNSNQDIYINSEFMDNHFVGGVHIKKFFYSVNEYRKRKLERIKNGK